MIYDLKKKKLYECKVTKKTLVNCGNNALN